MNEDLARLQFFIMLFSLDLRTSQSVLAVLKFMFSMVEVILFHCQPPCLQTQAF